MGLRQAADLPRGDVQHLGGGDLRQSAGILTVSLSMESGSWLPFDCAFTARPFWTRLSDRPNDASDIFAED
jgi:hypothetical protein